MKQFFLNIRIGQEFGLRLCEVVDGIYNIGQGKRDVNLESFKLNFR